MVAKHSLHASALAAAVQLSACVSVAPSEVAPQLPEIGSLELDGLERAVPDDWWSRFGDSDLTALVRQALRNNRDLAAAEANVRAAQILLAGRRLDGAVSTTSTAGASLSRPASANADLSIGLDGGLSARWEYDAFGRIAALVEAAELDLETAREVRRDIAVIIASETALAYADLRGAQRRLEVARRNVEVQTQSFELLQTLFDNGRATELDLSRAEAQFRTTLATIPLLEQAAENAVSRLAALTGQSSFAPDERLDALDAGTRAIPELDAALVTGSLEDMIRRRPDIRAAEARLASDLALGEAARADLFPTITFNADVFAILSDDTGFDGSDFIGFSVGPAIRWAGPDLRRERLAVDLADARAEASARNYEQTVIAALSEVDIALTSYARELQRRDDLVIAVESAARAVELARLRFEEGYDDFLDVLDAQQTLLDAEDRLALSRVQATRNAISAYRALGGMVDLAPAPDAPTVSGALP
jgi:outer membrane protein, multidrug efflux system